MNDTILTQFYCYRDEESDEMKLDIRFTGITDLSPLKYMPLQDLSFFPGRIRKGLHSLRGIETLKKINRRPTADFWQRYVNLPDSGMSEKKRIQKKVHNSFAPSTTIFELLRTFRENMTRNTDSLGILRRMKSSDFYNYVWLPWGDAHRTNNPKTAWEIMPYYTRCYEKKPFFIRGSKPQQLAEISKITQRQWQRYETDQNRQNPILTGMRYLKVFEQESVTSYAKAAEILGVSRVRVYQLASLVMKLPKEIVDFLAGNEDPAILRHFTERRLRPLTMLPSKKAQLAQFREMLTDTEMFKDKPCKSNN